MDSIKDDKGVATLERALAILHTFEGHETQALADIARRTGLYKSTLLRLLATLQKFGYIGQQPDGAYHVGVAALHLGSLYQAWVKPAAVITPALQRLTTSSGESSSFYVREGGVRVCVYRIDSTHKIRDHIRVGDILPLDKGAAGRILSAFADPATGSRALKQACVCLTRGEIEPDTAAIAAPVFGRDGRLEGALALTGPASRFVDLLAENMKELILSEAIILSRDLGGNTSKLEVALHHVESSMTKFS